MKKLKVFGGKGVFLVVPILVLLLVSTFSWAEGTREVVGHSPGTRLIAFAVLVEAPESYAGKRIVVENKKPKLFGDYKGSHRYFRVLTNIDIYGLDNSNRKVQINEKFRPKIFIEVPYTDYDVKMAGGQTKLKLLFWDTGHRRWISLEDLEKAGELKRVPGKYKNSFRFVVLVWPINDKYIAFGG